MTRTRTAEVVALTLMLGLFAAAATGFATGNLLENGGFSRNLESWEVPAGDMHGDLVTVEWSATDAGGSAVSGSLRGEAGSGVTEAYFLSQGVTMEAGAFYEMGARVFIPAGQGPAGQLRFGSSDRQCTGGLGNARTWPLEAPVGTWTEVSLKFRALSSPCNHVDLVVTRDSAGGAFVAYFDDVYLKAASPDVPRTVFVPGVAHASGLDGTFWMTDFSILNSGETTVDLELSYRGSVPAETVVATLGARSQLAMPDVLISAFGLEVEDVGVVTVTSNDEVEVTARTYTLGGDSCTAEPASYGLSYPGMTADEALPGTRLGYLSGLRSDGAFRTNLELANAGATRATAEVRFFDAEGAAIGQPVIRQVGPGRRVGVTSALPPGHPSAYAELRLSPPEARVIAFASVIDGVSGDPAMVALRHGPFRSDVSQVPPGSLNGDWEVAEELIQRDQAPAQCNGYDLSPSAEYGLARGFSDNRLFIVQEDDRVSICVDWGDWGTSCHEGQIDGARLTATLENQFSYPIQDCNLQFEVSHVSTIEATVVNLDRIEGVSSWTWAYSGGGQSFTVSSRWSFVLTRVP